MIFAGCLTCRYICAFAVLNCFVTGHLLTTGRKRKLKCDEIRPTCTKCATQRFPCDWAAEHTAIECTPVRRQTQAQPRESQHSGLSGHSHVVTIKPSLTETHLECANSVTLTAQDRRSLEYFSSSTLYSMYNFGNWGTLQYVIREVAPCSSGVMRMILALTTSEMYRKGFRTGAGAADLGLHHYNLALKNLRDGLAGEQGVGGEGEESVEAILATIFFMVHYELQFSGSAGRVKAHFEGLWAVINTHPLFRKNVADDTVLQTGAEARTDARFVLCCQLLVWLLSVIPTSVFIRDFLANTLQSCRCHGNKRWSLDVTIQAATQLYEPLPRALSPIQDVSYRYLEGVGQQIATEPSTIRHGNPPTGRIRPPADFNAV